MWLGWLLETCRENKHIFFSVTAIMKPVSISETIWFDFDKSICLDSEDLKSDHFKWSGFQMAIVPTIRIRGHSKSGRFCPYFKWVLTKWGPFLQISNGWASGFQIPFKIRTIWNTNSFQPFKIKTSPEFRSPLYLHETCLICFIRLLNLIEINLWIYHIA